MNKRELEEDMAYCKDTNPDKVKWSFVNIEDPTIK